MNNLVKEIEDRFINYVFNVKLEDIISILSDRIRI